MSYFQKNCADLRNSLYLKLAKKLNKNHKVQIYGKPQQS